MRLQSSAREAMFVHAAGFRPEYYHLYGLAHMPKSEARTFVSYHEMMNLVLPALNDAEYEGVFDNKWLFALLMVSNGIPHPTTLGNFHPQIGARWGGDPLRTTSQLRDLLMARRPACIVAKPADGHQGQGLRVFSIAYDTPSAEVREDGTTYPLDSFLETLRPGGLGVLLQEWIRQHNALDALNPGTVNTLRAVTLRTQDGRVEILPSVLRVGRDGQLGDNWDQGGIAVAVDPDTGVLGKGRIKPKHGGAVVASHPDTGAPFEGAVLPNWGAVRALVERTALVVPQVRLSAWDIAFTPDGPIVVEGNFRPGIGLVQSHGKGYFGEAALVHELEARGVKIPSIGLASTARALARKTLKRILKRPSSCT